MQLASFTAIIWNLEKGLLKFSLTLIGPWASDRSNRRSISCCTIFMGGCLLFSSSRTQKLVSLSSAEAEAHACSSGTSDAILMARLVRWLTNKPTTIYLYTESSGARGIIQHQGIGCLRRLSCRVLWLQALVQNGTVRLSTFDSARSIEPS